MVTETRRLAAQRASSSEGKCTQTHTTHTHTHTHTHRGVKIEPGSCAPQADSLPSEPLWKPKAGAGVHKPCRRERTAGKRKDASCQMQTHSPPRLGREMCPLFPHVRPLCILPRFILESVLPDQENGSGGHLTPAARAWLPEGVMGKRLPCPHSPARRILSVLSIEKWHHKIKMHVGKEKHKKNVSSGSLFTDRSISVCGICRLFKICNLMRFSLLILKKKALANSVLFFLNCSTPSPDPHPKSSQ